jgi:hypothetical protein
MNQALDELFDDLDELYGSDFDLRAASLALENEARSNVNARALFAAICWISEQPRTPTEKVTAIAELVALPRGPVFIPSLSEFCGWGDATEKDRPHS